MADDLDVWKMVKTCWLFYAFFLPGISDAVMGPTLLDLELLASGGTSDFSYIILMNGVGTVVGSIMATLFTSIDIRLRLGMTLLVGSINNIVMALLPSFAYLMMMFTMQGFIKGIVVVYLIERCSSLWQEKAVPYQFILSGAMAGAVLAPFITQPFLCNKEHRHEEFLMSHVITPRNFTKTNLPDERYCTSKDTRVKEAYVYLGVLTLPCAFAFLYYFARSLYHDVTSDDDDDDGNVQKVVTGPSRLNQKWLYYTFLAFVFIYFIPVVGNIVTYATFLTLFGVQGPLQLRKKTMVLMTSFFFACCLFGRVINTAVTPYLGSLRIILINGFLLLATGFALITLGTKEEPLLWLCTGCFGFTTSPMMGAGFAWTSEQIAMTPTIVSYCVLSISVGNMILPFVGGLLFHSLGPNSFIHVVFVVMLFQVLTFNMLLFLSTRFLPGDDLLIDGTTPSSTDTSNM